MEEVAVVILQQKVGSILQLLLQTILLLYKLEHRMHQQQAKVMAISASDFYVYSGAHIVRKNSAESFKSMVSWYCHRKWHHRLFVEELC